jgi:hypothetical protein
MKSIKQFFSIALISLLFVCKLSFALPFSVTPFGSLPTVVDNLTPANAFYTVRNITTVAAPGSFVKFLPPYVKQVVDLTKPTYCEAVFTLAPGASCILALNVSGPVDFRDPNPEHHLFVCRAGGKTCAGTASELNVTLITLVSITLNPSTPQTLPNGRTLPFSATGTFSDGTTRLLSGYDVLYTTSNQFAISINPITGLATAVASSGIALIRAELGGITSAPTTVTATIPALVSIFVTPTLATIADGQTLQYTATGTYTDGHIEDISSSVVWRSSNCGVATIAPGGLATGLSAGASIITAESGSIISNQATLNVTNAVLQSIIVTPNPANVSVGGTVQFTARGVYSDGSILPISAAWTSSNTSFATINSSGLASGVAPGTLDITASSGAFTATVPLTVSPVVLQSIVVTPTDGSVPVGASIPFTATGIYSNGTNADITDSVLWTSSTGAASITTTGSNRGIATGVSTMGSPTTITATSGLISGSAPLIVTAAVLQNIVVTPNPANVAAGGTITFTATGYYSDGSVATLTTGLTWESSNTSAAVFANPSSGVATGVTGGMTTNVKVTQGTVTSQPVVLTVSAALVSIDVTPNPMVIYVGESFPFKAEGTYSAGPNSDITNSVGWDSSDPLVATVGATTGIVMGLTPGVTDILAAYGSVFGSADLTVNNQVLYAGLVSGNISRSTNGGATWTPTTAPGGAVRAMVSAAGYIYAEAGISQFCYTQNDSTFTCVSAFPNSKALAALDPGFVYVGSNSATQLVYVSSDNGLTFTGVVAYGSSADILTSLAVTDVTHLYAGITSGLVCRSFNNGSSWPGPCIATGLSNLTSLAVNRASGHVFAGGTLSGIGGVCKSTDSGATYACSSPFADPVLSLAAADIYVYAGTSGGTVCKSTNGAGSFTCVGLPAGYGSVTSLTLDKYGSVFAGTSTGKVCRSFDNGATWRQSLCQTVNGVSQVNGLALTLP